MDTTEDRIEDRNFKEIDLNSAHVVDLFRYYHKIYLPGNHRYEFDNVSRPKRVQSAAGPRALI